MNIPELPFDTEEMIAGLRLWVEAESPGDNPAAVNRVIDLAAYDLACLGATIQRIPGRMGFADTLRARLDPSHSAKPGVLICCHADTVHPQGSLDSMPYRREGNTLWGAGIASAKAGIFICLEALRQLTLQNLSPRLPVTLLVVSDKEAGCASTREIIDATIRDNRYVLIPECVGDSQELIAGRYGQDRYMLDVKVDTVSEQRSKSAINEMARYIVAIDEMTTDTARFDVGVIESGKWVNCADKCTAEVLCEAHTAEDVSQSRSSMMAMNSPNPDKGLHVNRSTSLPLWPLSQSANPLIDVAREQGNALGLKLKPVIGSGGSMGNIAGASGVATLDGLGPVGAGIRTPVERVAIDSLVARGRLMAGLLTALS